MAMGQGSALAELLLVFYFVATRTRILGHLAAACMFIFDPSYQYVLKKLTVAPVPWESHDLRHV